MLIDSHVHVDPDVDHRVYDVKELVTRAREAGYDGLVLKSSQGESAGAATLFTSEELPLWGGIVLNRPCGGLNPAAVDSMLRLRTGDSPGRGRVVWLPTRHSEHHIAQLAPHDGPGVPLFQDGDLSRPRPELLEIMELVAEDDAILATGHADPAQIPAIVALARDRGVERIVITHVDQGPSVVPPDLQRELVPQGCYFEHCFVGLLLGPHAKAERLRGRIPATLERIMAGVSITGASRVIFSTDAGSTDFPEPIEAMQRFIEQLGAAGLTDADIERGTAANVLGLLER